MTVWTNLFSLLNSSISLFSGLLLALSFLQQSLRHKNLVFGWHSSKSYWSVWSESKVIAESELQLWCGILDLVIGKLDEMSLISEKSARLRNAILHHFNLIRQQPDDAGNRALAGRYFCHRRLWTGSQAYDFESRMIEQSHSSNPATQGRPSIIFVSSSQACFMGRSSWRNLC